MMDQSANLFFISNILAGGQDLSSHTRNVNSGKLNEAFTVEINSSDDNASSSSVTESDQQV